MDICHVLSNAIKMFLIANSPSYIDVVAASSNVWDQTANKMLHTELQTYVDDVRRASVKRSRRKKWNHAHERSDRGASFITREASSQQKSISWCMS